MQEYYFNVTDANGRRQQIKCNDSLIYYTAYRNALPEQLCIELINAVKQQSGKKVAIIWGNCQSDQLQRVLLRNATFADNYIILWIPLVFAYVGKDKQQLLNYFQENFWSICDLLISQRVNSDNRFSPALATNRLPALIPEDAKIIWIPNVYFDGYFPQYIRNLNNVGNELHQSGRFPNGDKYVDAFLENRGGGQDTTY